MSSCPSLHFSCENLSCDNWFCCGDYEPEYPVPVPAPHYSPDYCAPTTELVPPPYQKPPISAVTPPTEGPRCDMPLEPPVYEPAPQPPWTGPLPLPSPGTTTWPSSPPPPLLRNDIYESSTSPAPATSTAAHATASPAHQPHLDDTEPSISMESYPQPYHVYY